MDFIKKIDYKRELKDIYKPSHKVVSLLNVPALNYLMVEGSGNPNTSADYADAVEALYSLSYAIKFNIKKSGLAIDYGVMPLEGLWWVENMAEFDVNNKDKWIWTSMIMQPEIVTKKTI